MGTNIEGAGNRPGMSSLKAYFNIQGLNQGQEQGSKGHGLGVIQGLHYALVNPRYQVLLSIFPTGSYTLIKESDLKVAGNLPVGDNIHVPLIVVHSFHVTYCRINDTSLDSVVYWSLLGQS